MTYRAEPTPGCSVDSYHPGHGPCYPELASVEKWRRLERTRELTPDETRAYGAAVGAAFRKLNKTAKPYAPISMKSTAITTAKIRAAQLAALHASVEQDRRDMNYLFAQPGRREARDALQYSSTSQIAHAYSKAWAESCEQAYAEAMAAKRALAPPSA